MGIQAGALDPTAVPAANLIASRSNDDFAATSFRQDFVSSGTPVLIRNIFPEEWTIDWLRARLGDHLITARFYGPERFDLPKTQWVDYCKNRTMPFSEYATLLLDGTAGRERIYVANCDVSSTPVMDSIRGPLRTLEERTGLQSNGTSSYSMWLGAPGHTEPLHFDIADGILMNLRGSKHVTLVPPAEAGNLYPFGFFSGGLSPGFSKVYLNKPDFEMFPRMKSAMKARIDLTLGPGEGLFIPIGWWHEVTTLGTGYVCSLNRFWKVQPSRRIFVNRHSSSIFLVNQMFKPLAALARMMQKKPAAAKDQSNS